MSQNIEIEMKNLLHKEEFKKIMKDYPFPKQGDMQINYYFDTAQMTLINQSSALRIREKNDRFRLTLKEPVEEGILETHDPLLKKEALMWIDNHMIEKSHVGNRLKALGVNTKDLQYQGSLKTVRYEYQLTKDVTIVLDHSFYNDREDYELEVEATSLDRCREVFQTILFNHRIPKRKTPNKIERFYRTRKP